MWTGLGACPHQLSCVYLVSTLDVYANVPCRPPLKLGKLGETLGTRLYHLLFLSPRSLLGHVDFWMHMFQAGTSGMAGMALAVPVLRHWAFKVTTIDCRFFVRHPSVRAACKMGVGLMCEMMHHCWCKWWHILKKLDKLSRQLVSPFVEKYLCEMVIAGSFVQMFQVALLAAVSSYRWGINITSEAISEHLIWNILDWYSRAWRWLMMLGGSGGMHP